ncbi:MAG: helitron helicase-like domain-containing protein [Bacteroidota bacterium]
MRFYAHRLHVRSNAASPERHVFSALHRAKKLWHEYCLDAYLKIESSRLDFQRNHKKQLRADLYHGLEDAVANGNEAQAGRFVLLASSFQGGPREMRAAYQDSMAIVREYGKPDFFVTFTCNPSWPEIQNELYDGQEAKDRPDLICRVFHMKLKEMLHEFHEKHVLGKLAAYTYSVEYQKRGLPHAHILLILERGCKVPPEELDRYVCAEIPDPVAQPRLHRIVTSNSCTGLAAITTAPRRA